MANPKNEEAQNLQQDDEIFSQLEESATRKESQRICR